MHAGADCRWTCVLTALAWIASCSSTQAPQAPACGGTVEQPIVNGSAQETYLGLSQGQIAAIVLVADATNPNGAFCSGALVAPDWVVTAKHCLAIAAAQVVVRGPATPQGVFPVISRVGHATEDVALLQVDTSAIDGGVSDGGIAGVSPLQPGGASVAKLQAGTVVEVAGYGVTETGTARALRFLAETIQGTDNSTITVSGLGASGACAGDSGGPLLVRGPDGSPVVAGVESAGSATCRDQDIYVRLDAVQDWLQATIGAGATSDGDCGPITAQGRCLYGSALWCFGSRLASQTCTGQTRCGWDRAQAGFRCVSASADPCDGVDSVGACVNDDAEWCPDGVLARLACGPCNVCRVDGKTGSPECIPASATGDGTGG